MMRYIEGVMDWCRKAPEKTVLVDVIYQSELGGEENTVLNLTGEELPLF